MYEGEICDKFALALNQIDLIYWYIIVISSEIFIFLLFEI